jgi:hypothetical protein
MLSHIYWWMVGLWYLPVRRLHGSGDRLLGIAWLGLSIATPFYHPYARLWLPLHLLGLVVTAEYLRFGLDEHEWAMPSSHNSAGRAPAPPWSHLLWAVIILTIVTLRLDMRLGLFGGPGEFPAILSSSDSLRSAVQKFLADLPDGTPGLRLLVRPPVTFYLGGRVPAQAEPDLAGLLQPRDPRLWALVDLAQLRQEGDTGAATKRLLERWEKVREYPTQLNLPTLLDIDPGAARAGRSDATLEPLWLLRPRPAGAT